MNNSEQFKLPPEQQAIQAKCFHPTGPFVEFPKEDVEQSIPARFEKIVRRYPDRIAIKLGDQTLTYAELNCRANRLARSIVDQQGEEAEPIALLLENVASLMAATLGALKAGKFVVLLDLSFPESRNAAILEDSQAKLIISNRQNAPLVGRIGSRACRMMDLESVNSATSDDNLQLSISPKALAFLIYTSGSTGQPKAVMQDHRNRLHQFRLSINTNHICEHDRASLLTSGTSSAVVTSLRTLLNGAMLLPFDVRREGINRLANWLWRERISVCAISSPLFRNLCETLTGREEFPDLRLIRLGSETAYKTDFDLYKKYFSPKCLLANGLSLTETGTLTDYLMDQETEIPGNEIPVGYPLEDVEISLLNDENKDVGFNQVGEIVVRSQYLSLGYWRRPDLTEAKFKPDPEGGDNRFCRTGDLGLRLPDGCMILRGRKDFRVKIRGYGVEIAEAENVLRGYAAIDDAVVVAHENESGEARLVAYFTSPNQPGPNVSELRGFLKDKLPDYMIPSAFMKLDAIPLTHNGKIDRRALPDPKKSRPDLNTPLVAPRTSNEEKLVKIWAEELRIDQIGVQDNFFDLGGHSLLAMRVISQIRDDLQVELSLSHFFETPTVAALARYIETARSQRNGPEALSIQSASRDGLLLLSFGQQRLWFIDQLEPGSAAYNLFSATVLTGRLDVMALEQSFNEIIRRHEALRTVFKSVNGQPFQVILPTLSIALPVVDLRDIASAAERAAEIRRLSTAEARRPFDLARGPLLRATLLQSSGETYVLLLTIHHIIFDGLSSGILDRELSVLYEAFSSGKSASRLELPIQYADFAQWQRQSLGDKALEEQVTYWKKQLENLPTLQLPSDRPRPAVQTYRGARQSFRVAEDLVEGLKILGRQEGVTLFMTLLAAYLALLRRYSGQNDIGIGSPISGRNRSELEGLIGFFLNMLVLRTDLSDNPTFRELLSRVRKVCLEAYANQEVPFEKLVQELQPHRSLSHNPLVQVTFALQNTPTFPLKLAGVTAEDLDLGSGIASFDLHLFMIEDETTLSGWLVYNTDLFDADTITRMTGHFHRLLETIVANSDQRISELPMLTEGEKHQLLVEWNDTKRDYPRDKHIHERFEGQVERTPEAIAVVYEDKQLTYRELNNRSNQLARYLQKRGVGPEVLVGLCVERSVEMIVGLLGILKAGGAYVPLDPGYPKERLAFMLNDAQVSLLLTQQRLVANLVEDRELKPVLSEIEGIEDSDSRSLRLSSGQASILDSRTRGVKDGDPFDMAQDRPRSSILYPRSKVLSLDVDWETIAQESEENPASQLTPDNLAYVIYTSGSTGKPKGAEIRHGELSNYLNHCLEYYPVREGCGSLVHSSIAFDATITGLYPPLLAGRAVYLIGETNDCEALGKKLREIGDLSLVKITPTHLALLNLQIPPDEAEGLTRAFVIGGENLLAEQITFWQTHAPGTLLFNEYGPTEATVGCIVYEASRWQRNGSVPIGQPIANTRIYILDPQFQPVPIGVLGEIYIGGDGVARGYLNRPELTAERFIYHSWDGRPAQRLYRTGDIARYLPDGNIQFLGRSDKQVQLRGYRIELGEIETVLAQHTAVRRAVVVASEDHVGDKRLVAYVVAKESTPAASELRAFLKAKLPEYMVPSAFVVLNSLPLTPNGKVDRKALPSPDGGAADLEQVYVAPRNAAEQITAGIWAEILGKKRIGVHDNFFDLGGHSLKATQVVSRLRKVFRSEIPLRHLFEYPTIAEFAAVIGSLKKNTADENKLDRVLSEVAALSEAEAQRFLAEKLDGRRGEQQN